ncbi:MAG: hypothetical protein KatS3mg076_1256 [Candidatus Binatia bacterium]|nr:MAG: hypothetical protein KatS3mg076_1256 [Candidatus Binatia bacterium]
MKTRSGPRETRGYLKIGEVARRLGVAPSVLRYWEQEFPMLRPSKTPSGHRLYAPEHIEALREVKRLLYDEGLTIAGARKRLRQGKRKATGKGRASGGNGYLRLLRYIRRELESLRRLLS